MLTIYMDSPRWHIVVQPCKPCTQMVTVSALIRLIGISIITIVPTRDKALRELLWNDGDEKYYPLGMDDPDYCVIEFTAERAEYYRYDGKGALDAKALAALDENRSFENGYLITHPQAT